MLIKHVTRLISKNGRYSCLLNKSVTQNSVTLSSSAITEKNIDNENNATNIIILLKTF